jgi:hypothetical protein
LTGDKAGQSEVFADNLPLLPDNIRPSGRGGFWLGGSVSRYPGQFSTEYLMTLPPWIRNTICKVNFPFHHNFLIKTRLMQTNLAKFVITIYKFRYIVSTLNI